MKKVILSVLLLSVTAIAAAQNITIAKQGHFSVGGQTVQRPGAYDNSKFVGWAAQEETGQSYRADHAFVDFQIPVDSKKLPLVYVHGYGGSGVCWQMTPDGRDGFATLMLRHGWSSYVVDLPGRGRAGRTSATTTVKPVADEMFWFDIWRIGIWPNYNEGVQFPKDSVSLSQFFREMTPDISDHKQDIPALGALATLQQYHREDGVLIYGIDGSPDFKSMLKLGYVTATSMQSPKTIGRVAAETAYQYLDGQKVDPYISIEPTLITRENLGDYEINGWQ